MNQVCPHRSVTDDGRVFCRKIVWGDSEVSPNVCRACPARLCNCAHLRFSLQKKENSPIVVRYGNGRTEVWDDDPPQVGFLHAACTLKVAPIASAKDCAGCNLRRAILPLSEVATGERKRASRGKIIAFPQQPVAIAS